MCCVGHGWGEFNINEEDREHIGQEQNGCPFIMKDKNDAVYPDMTMDIRQRALKTREDVMCEAWTWSKITLTSDKVCTLLIPAIRQENQKKNLAFLYRIIARRAKELDLTGR